MKYDKANRKLENLAIKSKALQGKHDAIAERCALLEQVLKSTMHEIRRFSGELSTHLEALTKVVKSDPKPDSRVLDYAETAFFTSGMLAARLGFTDIELNPATVQSQARLSTGIYKKFEKARHILTRQARFKQVDIVIQGASFAQIDALQAFELVPFVILDNAIKYSPKQQQIVINFVETQNDLEVTVKSIGPIVLVAELQDIFNKEKRASNAIKASIAGDGLGLYLAKTLCDLHGVIVSAMSDQKPLFHSADVPYSQFTLKLFLRRF